MTSDVLDEIKQKIDILDAHQQQELLIYLRSTQKQSSSYRWSDLQALASYPFCSTDAQQWVNQIRTENDQDRRVM